MPTWDKIKFPYLPSYEARLGDHQWRTTESGHGEPHTVNDLPVSKFEGDEARLARQWPHKARESSADSDQLNRYQLMRLLFVSDSGSCARDIEQATTINWVVHHTGQMHMHDASRHNLATWPTVARTSHPFSMCPSRRVQKRFVHIFYI